MGDQISGITYRWAQQGDLRGICECTQNACPEFTEYYQNESLYAKDSDERALIAVAQGGQVAGTLIVGGKIRRSKSEAWAVPRSDAAFREGILR